MVWGFFLPRPQSDKEKVMDQKELAYAKQGALATKNWDCFQRVIRRCLRCQGGDAPPQSALKRITPALVTVSLFMVMLMCFSASALAKTRTLKKGPAIVLVAFGTTTQARETYDVFAEQLKNELPEQWRNVPISWAYTSEIVRERANKQFAEKGVSERYRSLPQVLASLEDQGYRQIAIQSLHIFPGQEYEDMEQEIAAFRGLGLRIEYGGTLLHTWERAFEAVSAVAPEFLSSSAGCTVLVTHGTPETFSGANNTYLGLDRYLNLKYSTVFVGTVEGVLTRDQALEKAKACTPKRVRIVPFMYVAGDHVMNDIMGEKVDEDGVLSWAMELRSAGVSVETVSTDYQGRTVFKGLGFYPEINRIFIEQLLEGLERLNQ